MTYRNRKLLDIYHDAPCFLNLTQPCGQDKSVPCHSDMLRHDRGANHKSHDCLSVPGCPACHAVFTRERLGRGGYEEVWIKAFEQWIVWAFSNERIGVL